MSFPIFTLADLAHALEARLGVPVRDLRLLPGVGDPSTIAWTATTTEGVPVSGVVRLQSCVGDDQMSIVIEPKVFVDGDEPVPS